ncbi:MAG: ABC-2 family transporter protein [Pseudomonadota bacterium]
MMQTNVRAAAADRRTLALMTTVMTVNNLIWFAIWIVFFGIAGEIRGWGLADVARLFGMVAFSYGLAFATFGGAWRMARLIADGQLDIHLARPKSPLAGLVFSRAEPEAAGDMASGIILLAVFGGLSWGAGMGVALLSLAVATILVSTAIMVNSLIFWSSGRTGVVDQIFDAFISLSTMPQHGLPKVVKILLFTALPAGFVAFLPADILRDFAAAKLAAMAVATLVFPVLAVVIFNQGLKRYTSGNRMLELR